METNNITSTTADYDFKDGGAKIKQRFTLGPLPEEDVFSESTITPRGQLSTPEFGRHCRQLVISCESEEDLWSRSMESALLRFISAIEGNLWAWPTRFSVPDEKFSGAQTTWAAVIDQYAESRITSETVFVSHRHNIVSAREITFCLSQLRRHRPAMVFLDDLPGLDDE